MIVKGVLHYQQAQHDSRALDEAKIVGKIMQKATILGNTYFQNRELVTTLCAMKDDSEMNDVIVKALFDIMKHCVQSEKIACMSGEG
ncbi:MAG: hypothetical protein PHN18_12455 [Sulfurospirillaceae bacterium]|nr:hypothetical protein [Sulfurospirillaceae bacterium]MDD2826294.1 hypothetical protein [Sulfurospirillaceae bacterium]